MQIQLFKTTTLENFHSTCTMLDSSNVHSKQIVTQENKNNVNFLSI